MTTRRLVFSAVAIVFLLLPFARLDAAVMYKWVDKEGIVHITDYPDPFEAEAEDRKEKAQKIKTEEKIKADDKKTKQLRDAKNAPPAQSTPKTPIQNSASPVAPATAKSPMTNTVAAKPAIANASVAQAGRPGVVNAPIMNASAAQTQRPIPLSPMQAQKPSGALGAVMSAFAGLALIAVALVAACALLQMIGLFVVAKKLSVPAPWLAFIPLAQLYPLVVAAGKPAWWIVLCLVPVVNMFVFFYLFMLLAERMGKNKFLGLIHLLPIIGTIVYWIILLRATPASSSSTSQFTVPEEQSSSTESFGQEGETQEENPFKDLEQ